MRYSLILTLFAAIAFSACSSSAPQPVNVAAANKPANNKPVTSDHKEEDNIKRTSLADAKAAVEAKTAVIVDVRDASAWKSERIKDSLSAPLATFDAELEKLPKDKQLIFYCSCPHEHSAVVAAQKAEAKGVKNVSALLGGTQGWKDAKYPMDGDGQAAANQKTDAAAAPPTLVKPVENKGGEKK